MNGRDGRLLAFATELQRAETFAQLLEATRDEIQAALGYAHAWLFVAESDDAHGFRLVEIAGGKRDVVLREYPRLEIRGDAMLEEIAQATAPVVVVDARTDPRTNKAIVAQLGNRTIVNVPLRVAREPFGAFGTGTFGEEGVKPPTDADVDYLGAMAAQLSIAGQRIRLTEARGRAEEARRRSDEMLAATLDSIGDGVIATDGAGKLTRMNPVAERLTGWSLAEATGRSVAEVFRIVNEHTRAPVESPVDRILRDGVVVGRANDTVLVARDGTERPIADTGAPIRDARGDLRGVVLVFRDESEHRVAERLREESSARLALLAESSRQFAGTRGVERLLEAVTRRMSEIIGELCAIRLVSRDGGWLLPTGAIWHTDPSLLAAARRTDVASRQRLGEGVSGKVAATGESILVPRIETDELVARSPPQYRAFIEALAIRSLLVVPLEVEGRVIGVVNLTRSDPARAFTPDDERLARDLAGRAALAVVNAQLLDELEERVAQRTLAMDQAYRELETFSYSVAHDLRAPLRGIGGFSAALLDDYGATLDEGAKEHVRRVMASTVRMGEIIDALLSLARLTRTELHLELVDLAPLARSIVDQLRLAEPERVVEFVSPETVVACADPVLVRLALENLLRNAWKFTRRQPVAKIVLGVVERDGARHYEVRDNGTGFSMAYAAKLFAPFQRLHSPTEFEGNGVGLATVERIIKRHGGRIWAESAEGAGAAFHFTLPAAPFSPARGG